MRAFNPPFTFHRRIVGLLLCTVILGSSGRALAQAGPNQGSATEAQTHFDEGLRFYNIGEYDRAIEAFRSAYMVTNSPRYLFSMAQAYRMKGDCEKALEIYESYRRMETSEENRLAADRLIGQARTCAQKQAEKKQEETKQGVVVAPTSVPAPTGVTETPAQQTPRSKSWLPWVVTGVGGALVITGVILVVNAAGRYSDLEKQCGQQCDPAQWQGVDTREKAGYVLLATGAAAAVGGITWWYLGSRRAQVERRAWIAPTLGGIRVGGTF